MFPFLLNLLIMEVVNLTVVKHQTQHVNNFNDFAPQRKFLMLMISFHLSGR